MRKKVMALLLSGAMVVSPLSNLGLTTVANAAQDEQAKQTSTKEKEQAHSYDAYDEEEFIISAEELGFATGVTPAMVYQIEEIATEEIPQELEEDAQITIEEDILPNAVDNTGAMGEHGYTYFPEIGNQRSVGSCFSWSMLYYVATYEQNKYADRPVSEENIMSPKYNYYVGEYEGMYWPDPVGIGMKTIKEVPLTNFSTNAEIEANPLNMDRTEEEQLETLSHSGSWYEIDTTSMDGIEKVKALLNEGEIFALGGSGTTVTTTIPKGYSHAGEYIAKCYLGNYNHELTIVGYDDNVAVDLDGDGQIADDEKGAFKIANSWGNFARSNNGFYWLSYDAFLENGKYKPDSGNRFTATHVCGFVPKQEETDFYAVVTVEEEERSDLYFIPNVGLDEDNNGTYEKTVINGNFAVAGDSRISGTNMAGETGVLENVIIINLGCYNNSFCDSYFTDYIENGISEDIGQAIEKCQWSIQAKDINRNNSTGFIIKSIVFVDNVNKVSYAGNRRNVSVKSSSSAYSASTIILDKNNIVPTVEAFDAVEVSDGFNITVNATDDGDNLKYRYYVIDENNKQKTISDYTTSTSVVAKNLVGGTYKVCVDVKDNDGNIITKKIVREITSNTKKTVVYYANSNFKNANIHYKTANGSWTSAPGVKMKSSNEKEGYTWKYTINMALDKSNEVEVCFNDGNGVWDSNNGKNYVLGVGEFGVKDGNAKELFSFSIDTFTTSYNSPALASEAYLMTYFATAKGDGEYEYRFGLRIDGTNYYFYDGAFSTSNSVSGNIVTLNDFDINKLFDDEDDFVIVDVRDVNTGKVVSEAKKFAFLPMGVNLSHNASSTTIKLGQTVDFSAYVYGEFTYRYNTHTYYVIKDGVKKNLISGLATNADNASWTPSEAGTYTIQFYVKDYLGQEVTKEITFEVIDPSARTAYVYYNSNWDAANIHYQVEDGTWTSAPGVKMTKVDDVNGYNYVYAIDLGSKSSATVCFNNGNGTWDSNGGSNYKVYAGDYGIDNGKVTKIEVDKAMSVKLYTDKEVGGTNKPLEFTAIVKNGTAPYEYNIEAVKGDSSFTLTGTHTDNENLYKYTWNSIYTAATYDFVVTVTDADGNVATDTIKNFVIEGEKWEYFTVNRQSPQEKYTAIIVDALFTNVAEDKYDRYSFTASKDGNTVNLTMQSDHKAMWIPTEDGVYTLTATYIRYSGMKYSISMEYVIKESNTVTIYYDNDSFAKANIHYQVGNGSWTAVPGVEMNSSNQANYKWMYTIDLDDAEYANVCFNNGGNQWDSKGGSNYHLEKGIYGIKNGELVKYM